MVRTARVSFMVDVVVGVGGHLKVGCEQVDWCLTIIENLDF